MLVVHKGLAECCCCTHTRSMCRETEVEAISKFTEEFHDTTKNRVREENFLESWTFLCPETFVEKCASRWTNQTLVESLVACRIVQGPDIATSTRWDRF